MAVVVKININDNPNHLIYYKFYEALGAPNLTCNGYHLWDREVWTAGHVESQRAWPETTTGTSRREILVSGPYFVVYVLPEELKIFFPTCIKSSFIDEISFDEQVCLIRPTKPADFEIVLFDLETSETVDLDVQSPTATERTDHDSKGQYQQRPDGIGTHEFYMAKAPVY